MADAARPRTDLPTIEEETQAYWDGAKDHRLLIASCRACGRTHHYPRPFCPFCWSDDVEAIETSGRGTLYTYSTVFMNDLPPFNERLPYVAAMVDLAEGPRIATDMVECDPADLSVGMEVEVVFQVLTDEITAPFFRPAT
jgi:uncharacterized OB-fold protein